MKRINAKIILVILSGVLFSGCEQFLEGTDPSNFNQDNYFTQASHADAIVNATYQSLYPMLTNQAWLITELRTGAANSTFGADGGFPSFRIVRELDISASHPSLDVIWKSHYQGIGNANLAISEIPHIQMDEAIKNQYLAEVRFLRAYFYYNLVRIFGQVPLIVQPVDLGSDKLYPDKDALDDIYTQIVEDLQAAEGAGLAFRSAAGRVSLGAVKSLLTDVYLTMAGFPLEKGREYYALARDKAKEVIESKEFSLFDDYGAFRNKQYDNTGEHIFMVQFHELDQPSDALQIGLVPFKLGVSRYSSEQGFSFVQREFVESYEPGDRRAQERTFFYSNYTSESDRNQIVDFGEYYNYKFFDENAHLNSARSGLNWQIIRYADVLFDYAEASNEISGPDAEAHETINLIRRRANLPELAGLSQLEFREAVWRERWHETFYEGELWFDMIRTRKVFNYLNNSFQDYVGHSFPTGERLSEKDLVFPIPATEILNNPNLIQNTGY